MPKSDTNGMQEAYNLQLYNHGHTTYHLSADDKKMLSNLFSNSPGAAASIEVTIITWTGLTIHSKPE